MDEHRREGGKSIDGDNGDDTASRRSALADRMAEVGAEWDARVKRTLRRARGKKKKQEESPPPPAPLFCSGRVLPMDFDGDRFSVCVTIGDSVIDCVPSTVGRTLTLSADRATADKIQVPEDALVCCTPAKRSQMYCAPVSIAAHVTSDLPRGDSLLADFEIDNETQDLRVDLVAMSRCLFHVSESAQYHRLGLVEGRVASMMRLRDDAFGFVHGPNPLLAFGRFAVFPDGTPRIPLLPCPAGAKPLFLLPLLAIEVVHSDGRILASNKLQRAAPALLHYAHSGIVLPGTLHRTLIEQIHRAGGLFRNNRSETEARVRERAASMPALRFVFQAEAGDADVKVRIDVPAKDYTRSHEGSWVLALEDGDQASEWSREAAEVVLGNCVFRSCNATVSPSRASAWLWTSATDPE